MRRMLGYFCGVLVAALLGGGCSSGERAAPPAGPNGPTGPSARSHPFAVSGIPEGYDLVAAGTGMARPEWLDTGHSTPNLTVLRPTAGSVGDDVLVSGGSGAVFGNPEPDGHLVFVDRPETALQVRGRVSESVLQAIARTASLDDGSQVPVIADPPKGWAVVGSVTGEAAIALDPGVHLYAGIAPGPRSAHVVAPLPSAVLAETSFGDVVVVTVQAPPKTPAGIPQPADVPSVEDLVRVAASVRPARASSWASLVDRVHG